MRPNLPARPLAPGVIPLILLVGLGVTAGAGPALAKSAPKAAAPADDCAPIGRTADGRLVYSLKCDNLPAPHAQSQVPSSPRSDAAPADEPEVERTGFLGLSYTRRKPAE